MYDGYVPREGDLLLDLKRCPRCHEYTDLKNDLCPYCQYRFAGDGAPGAGAQPSPRPRAQSGDDEAPGRSSVPHVLLLAAGAAVVILIIAFFLLHAPAPPAADLSPATVPDVTAAPTIPQCTVALTGQKLPGSRIQLHLMQMTCGEGDVQNITVTVNGQPAGFLRPQLGAENTYPGHAGTDTVVAVAVFSSGYEKTIFESAYP